MDQRLQKLSTWASKTLGMQNMQIVPASSDASFRRYFRITQGNKSFIVMDAPPEYEDCIPFVKMSAAMADAGLHVPEVLEQDLEQGFLLLSDLGAEQYLPHLNNDTADGLYADAIDTLLKLQLRSDAVNAVLPCYDRELLLREMELMQEWFFEKHLHLVLNSAQQNILNDAKEWLVQQAVMQPQVWVHRDYHSRNLMRTVDNNPGVLDFQDAVIGPLTYDLVSLLKDCYITWPRHKVESWLRQYHDKALAAGLTGIDDFSQLSDWFDAMGAQRHMKVLGIFSRLNIRDSKSGYLQDIPRVFDYVVDACRHLPQLHAFGGLLTELVLPRIKS